MTNENQVGNPVMELSFEKFMELLELCVQTAEFMHAQKTKTTIELKNGWCMLKGEKAWEQLSPWTWAQLKDLKVPPLVAALYMRMVGELEKRNPSAI